MDVSHLIMVIGLFSNLAWLVYEEWKMYREEKARTFSYCDPLGLRYSAYLERKNKKKKGSEKKKKKKKKNKSRP